MITAQIAYNMLDDQAKKEVDRLIKTLAQYGPQMSDFAETSTWMDAIKRTGLNAFDIWHYRDAPYNADGLPEVAPAGEQNVVWAIKQATATLKSPDAGDFEKALMLRFLIHFAGDIHQPLHCVSRYTKALPAGDRGGNDFKIKTDFKYQDNLHSFWDAAANLYNNNIDTRLPGWKKLVESAAQDVMNKVPKNSLAWTADDPEVWAKESYGLAVSYVYQNIEEGGTPSEAYVTGAQKIILERLAMGGYRLGALLQSIFGKHEEQTKKN